MDIEKLKNELTPLDITDLKKFVNRGQLLQSDADVIFQAFFAMEKNFQKQFRSIQNYRSMPTEQRRAYMQFIEGLVWTVQDDIKIPGHLHTAVGIAVFYKQLEGLETGSFTTFMREPKS